MKNNTLLFFLVSLSNFLFCSTLCAFNENLGDPAYDVFIDNHSVTLVAPPTVSSVIYYCQGSSADPLSATPTAGNTLLWYGTNSTGGIGSTTAPIPSTTTVGSTTYYVSETDGVTESSRSSIVVNVVADNGSEILLLRCDPSQIALPDKYSSVYFDWTNTPSLPNLYTYFYSVDGGSPISGTTGPSNLQVLGLSPGQSVTLTLWHTTYPCDRSVITCSVPCLTTTTPTFNQISPVCQGAVAPILPSSSIEGITGTWNPATIDSNTTGTVSYTFTPDPVTYPCATPQTMSVTIAPKTTTAFSSIPLTLCRNSIYNLPSSSNNSPPITGTWNPSSAVNTSTLGPVTYTFTPDASYCTTTATTQVTLTIIPDNVIPTFDPVGPICEGDALAPLPTISKEGIVGAWSPALSNIATTTYTFTPSSGQCAVNSNPMTIIVNPKATPIFNPVSPICEGEAISPLPTSSTNGYTGIWSPVIDNTKTTTYTFTPDPGQCANLTYLTIEVNPLIVPDFSSVPLAICESSGDYILPMSSENSTPITGTWSPDYVDSNVVGTLSYLFTPDSGQCASEVTYTVRVNPSNTLTDFQWIVSNAFEENQIISIEAVAPNEDYLYQLDDGPFQSSSVFENVSSGTHSVTVIDQNGCSDPITKSGILVVSYPRYFTPNNDGYNDVWNIFDLGNQSASVIHIFDRFGRLLKELKPGGSGWNGTFNGRPLPADDYWFVINYTENDVFKEFKSHFSLKR